MGEEYNAMQYPEGWDKVKEEILKELPEDEKVREGFLVGLMQFLIQM